MEMTTTSATRTVSKIKWECMLKLLTLATWNMGKTQYFCWTLNARPSIHFFCFFSSSIPISLTVQNDGDDGRICVDKMLVWSARGSQPTICGTHIKWVEPSWSRNVCAHSKMAQAFLNEVNSPRWCYLQCGRQKTTTRTHRLGCWCAVSHGKNHKKNVHNENYAKPLQCATKRFQDSLQFFLAVVDVRIAFAANLPTLIASH